MDTYNTLDTYHFRTFINSEITRRWNKFPTPPNHMDEASIVILLLSSKDYTFNPFTFPWEHVYHEFYILMWKILGIRVKIDKKYTTFKKYILGRSADGYIDALGLSHTDGISGTDIPIVDDELRLEIENLDRSFVADTGETNKRLCESDVVLNHFIDDIECITKRQL